MTLDPKKTTSKDDFKTKAEGEKPNKDTAPVPPTPYSEGGPMHKPDGKF